ncbi:MAG: hypothetical protein BWY09_01383 [Candidatus Hydrogenedentes bacterium ADurb.Bin179]|nr:MAG: hypothetical protein BWY09_01383 [Candidatus Hydrogenedentes bacterium ADurb.Bin179]
MGTTRAPKSNWWLNSSQVSFKGAGQIISGLQPSVRRKCFRMAAPMKLLPRPTTSAMNTPPYSRMTCTPFFTASFWNSARAWVNSSSHRVPSSAGPSIRSDTSSYKVFM